jgi:type IV secretory pathway VirB2 component (pilin)
MKVLHPARFLGKNANSVVITAIRLAAVCFIAVALAVPVFAQQSPWGNAATKLANEFTGPIARGFALVAVVVGGLTIAFSENSANRTVGGLVMGLGLALGAASFITWLFN